MHTRAVVVLGCQIRVRQHGNGVELLGAAGRRARAGAEVSKHEGMLVVASGGRTWHGLLEADALAGELERLGVSARSIVRERESRNTRENAQRTAELLHREGLRHIVLVTCAWHMPRAASLFRLHGLEVEPFSASAGGATLPRRAYRVVREAVAGRLDRALLAWDRT